MPILEYRCDACGERFEWLRTRSDEPVPGCPGCGARQVHRLWSAFAVPRATPATPSAGPCELADCRCMRAGQDA